MRSIYGLTMNGLKEYLKSKGEKPFKSTQMFEWLYRHNVKSFDEMTNIKKDFIHVLKEDFSLDLLKIVTHQESNDGTHKYLLELEDGNLIEAVLMNHFYGNSICVTSEVGCNMGCQFCASGMKKKKRNLTTAEMVLQILTVERDLDIKIGHVVVMGIGEPLDNYDNVMDFLHVINEPKGLEIGARHISISTCGIVPRIYDYAKENLQSNLAISLHAPNDEIRNKIMPINSVYPIKLLVQAISDYIDATNRRVTIEYILIDGVNDSENNAHELSNLLRGLNVYINLIPYNPVNEKEFKRSTKAHMNMFYDTLKKRGMNVTLRKEQGTDIDAACGQLRSKHMN